ncbi:MAG: hypothetical protein R3F37_06325 [Candidatus Competibacteraceae bacterium]
MIGSFSGHKSGHALNNRLFASSSCRAHCLGRSHLHRRVRCLSPTCNLPR